MLSVLADNRSRNAVTSPWHEWRPSCESNFFTLSVTSAWVGSLEPVTRTHSELTLVMPVNHHSRIYRVTVTSINLIVVLGCMIWQILISPRWKSHSPLLSKLLWLMESLAFHITPGVFTWCWYSPSSLMFCLIDLFVPCSPYMRLDHGNSRVTFLQPFFRDHPGEPVPKEIFCTLWCKRR